MNQGFVFSNLTLRLGTAVICVVACAMLGIILRWAGINAPYLVFVPAIVGICALAGFVLALWTVFFSTLGLWLIFVPPRAFALPKIGDVAHIAIFVGVSIFACWIIDRLRRSNEQLSRDNVVLGCKLSVLLNRLRTP